MAKWYAATLLIVMLLALTMHLSMQQQSNAQINHLMQQLAKEHHWKLAEARLHMLRGALMLRQLDLKQGALHLHAPYVLLRGHFSDQLNDIRLTEVSMQQASIKWTPNDKQHFKMAVLFKPLSFLPHKWQSLFSSVRTLKLNQITLRMQSSHGTALTIKRIRIESEITSAARTWFASSRSDVGMFQWRSSPRMVELNWQHVDADLLRSFLHASNNTKKTKARLKGHIIWQDNQLSGNMDWRVNEQHGRLAWQGKQQEKKSLTITMHAKDWPLQGIPTGFPTLQGCAWQGGTLTGAAHITHQNGQWQINSKSLHVSEARSIDAAGKICLNVASLHLNNTTWRWPQRQITIKQASIGHGQWHVPTHLQMRSKYSWKIIQAQFAFSDITFNSDTVQLVDTYGTAEIRGDQWQLQAHNKTANKDQWSIRLSSPKDKYKAKQLFTFTAEGESLSPTIFRHFLPPRLANRAALTADIETTLSGSVTRPLHDDDPLSWLIQGDVLMSHVNWARDGWQGMTNNIRINGLTYKTGGSIQAKTVAVGGWTLIAPLTPFTAPDAKAEPWRPFWLEGWRIKSMHIGQGTFSIGWPKSIWMRLNPFVISPLIPNKMINMQWEGKFLDGDLTADIHWQPWQRPSMLELDLQLRHALPFAANPWLLQSDMPDFIRGRLNVMVDLTHTTIDAYNYTGQFHASLAHGSLAQGMQDSEAFVRITGVTPSVLLEKVNTNEVINIDVPLQGSWQTSPMNWGRISTIVLQALSQKAKGGNTASYVNRKNRKTLAYIRMHQENGLWPNERARLRIAIKTLNNNPNLVLELVPQLGRHTLDQAFIHSTRQTQQLIEGYLYEHQINPNRILPLWPQKAHKAGGEAGIRLQVYLPRSWQ